MHIDHLNNIQEQLGLPSKHQWSKSVQESLSLTSFCHCTLTLPPQNTGPTYGCPEPFLVLHVCLCCFLPATSIRQPKKWGICFNKHGLSPNQHKIMYALESLSTEEEFSRLAAGSYICMWWCTDTEARGWIVFAAPYQFYTVVPVHARAIEGRGKQRPRID